MIKRLAIIGALGMLIILQPLSAQTWQNSKRLTWTSGSSWDPAAAVDSSTSIHVVWDEYLSGNWEIYYKKSTDGGTKWTTKRLTWNAGDSITPSIATDSNNHIHVAWVDHSPGISEIYYKKSTDGGSSWTTKRLTWVSEDSNAPDIATDSNNHIHLVWANGDPGNKEIYYKKSTNGGAAWTTKRLTWNSGSSFSPAMVLDSADRVHVVFVEETPGNMEIYYKKSTDGGMNWTTKRLTDNAASSYFPAIATDSNNHIHVVWVDDAPGNTEIYYKKSTDGGAAWTTKRLTWNSATSYVPAVSIDSNNHVHVVWEDLTPGNSEIYHKKSTNGGISWTTKRLTWNHGGSGYPDIAIDSSNHLHVVWEDDTPGNDEIYFKKGIQ